VFTLVLKHKSSFLQLGQGTIQDTLAVGPEISRVNVRILRNPYMSSRSEWAKISLCGLRHLRFFVFSPISGSDILAQVILMEILLNPLELKLFQNKNQNLRHLPINSRKQTQK